jgi:predicted DNA-binding transcriptional regulator AlpA
LTEPSLLAPRPLAVPTLAEVQADPGVLDRLPVDTLMDLRRLVGYLVADVDAACWRRMASATGQQRSLDREQDKLLTAEEAAEIAGVKPSWLIRHAQKLPFTRKLSHKVVRYSEASLRKWLATRRL